MDTGFFRSKAFVVSAIVAAALVVGAALAYGGFMSGSWGLRSPQGCTEPAIPTGAPLTATKAESTDDGGRHRTLTFTLDAEAFDGGVLAACAAVARITVGASPDDSVHVTATIRAQSVEGAEATEVDARFQHVGTGLALAVWQPRIQGEENVFGGARTPQVTIEILLPPSGAYEVSAETKVGTVVVDGLLVGNVRGQTDVGEIHLTGLEATGNVSATTNVGEVFVELRSVQTGVIDVRTDVGDVDVRVPTRADVGYDVTAETDVGDVVVDVGATERNERDTNGPSERARVRTSDYAARPTQVVVRITVDVGDITVKTDT